MKRLRGSPPGSSSTSTVRSLCRDNARGRTAHVASSSLLSEYSCSIFLTVSGAGRVEIGASKRMDEGPTSFGILCWPRYRMNSSSLRRASSAYSPSSTTCLLRFHTTLLVGVIAALQRQIGSCEAAQPFVAPELGHSPAMTL